MTKEHSPSLSYEEEYKGYVIYVENNRDPYRGGYECYISDGENIINEELNCDAEGAVLSAKAFIDSL